MMNRDYFTRPTQAGGRSAHDYGHTHLGEPAVKNDPGARFCFWFGAAMVTVMIIGQWGLA